MLVTHEHLDHNGVETVGGDPVTLRSTAGRLQSPIGEVLGIAAEHDDVAGTERGANTLFVFNLAGRRVAHLGDLGQRALRDEQLAALGIVDLLFVRAGGGPSVVCFGQWQSAAKSDDGLWTLLQAGGRRFDPGWLH